MNNTLILTVGLPRAGKDTWAKSTGLPIVNCDAIRKVLHGQAFIKEAEPMVWTMAKYMVRSLFESGHEIVILSNTNTIKRNRDEWLNPKEWTVKYKCIRTDVETCKQRAIANKQEYLIAVIDKMNKQMEWPEVEMTDNEEYSLVRFQMLKGYNHIANDMLERGDTIE